MGLSITSRGLRPIADAIEIHRQILRTTSEEKRTRGLRVPARPIAATRGEVADAWGLVDCRPDVLSLSMA